MSDPADLDESSELAIALGTRILQERTVRKMTKEDLAARVGLSSRYIWRLESGRLNVQLPNLARIAKGLGLTIAQLTTGIEKLVLNPVEKPPTARRGPLPRAKRSPPSDRP
jgi:transcriptional regulator with XRE-family HTH domain